MSVSIGMVVITAVSLFNLDWDFSDRFAMVQGWEVFGLLRSKHKNDLMPCKPRTTLAPDVAAARARLEAVDTVGYDPKDRERIQIDIESVDRADDRAEGNWRTYLPRYCAPGYDPPWPPGG